MNSRFAVLAVCFGLATTSIVSAGIDCNEIPISQILNSAANCLGVHGFFGDFSKPDGIESYSANTLDGTSLEIISAKSSDGSKKMSVVAECDKTSGVMKIIGVHGADSAGYYYLNILTGKNYPGRATCD